MADTLVTPLNDSFVDLDVIGVVDASTYAVIGESHYVAMVREARRQRRAIDGTFMDWVVVRNRMSMLGSRNKRLVGEGWRNCLPGSAFAVPTGSPNGWFTASFSRAD
jgi:chromosome partitioning protein